MKQLSLLMINSALIVFQVLMFIYILYLSSDFNSNVIDWIFLIYFALTAAVLEMEYSKKMKKIKLESLMG